MLLLISYERSFGPPSDVEIDTLVSPDGKFKVVLFGSSSGGGFAPFCNYTFSVVPTDVESRYAWADTKRVAGFSCPSLKFGGFDHGVTWVENRHLQIKFDLTSAVQDGGMELKPRDATGQVQIDYAQ